MLKKYKALIENSSQGVKSSVAFALASAVSAGMSYLTTPVFTRMLTSTEYGEVTIYLTWQSIFAIIAMFSLNYGVFNNGMMDYKDDRDGYSYSLLRLSNIITICFAILVFSFQLFFPGILKIDIKYLALMFVVFLLWRTATPGRSGLCVARSKYRNNSVWLILRFGIICV